jgi:hypothetical protein
LMKGDLNFKQQWGRGMIFTGNSACVAGLHSKQLDCTALLILGELPGEMIGKQFAGVNVGNARLKQPRMHMLKSERG